MKKKRATKARKTKQLNVMVPPEIEEQLRAEAKARGASFAQVVRDIFLKHYTQAA